MVSVNFTLNSNNFQTDLFVPSRRPKQIQPQQVGVDLGVMAIKESLHMPKTNRIGSSLLDVV